MGWFGFVCLVGDEKVESLFSLSPSKHVQNMFKQTKQEKQQDTTHSYVLAY